MLDHGATVRFDDGGAERSHPSVTLAVLAMSGVAYAVLSSAVLPALPTIQHDLHASENGVAWLLTGYLLSASVGTAILGRLGDMYGKERVLVWTLVILGAGTVLAALSHSLTVVIAGRVVQGVAGGIFPLSFGIVRDEFPREKVAGSIGLLSAILGIGSGFGIVAGGIIVEHLAWQWLFWMPLVVIVVATFCTWRFIPESPVRVPGRVNWVAAGLMSVGISAVLLAISEATVWGWGSARTLGLLAAGLVVCGAWVAVESHSAEPLIDMTMMRIRGVWTTNLTAFLLGAGHVLVVHRLPAVRPAPAEHRLRIRCVRRRLRAVSPPVDDRDGRRRVLGRRDRPDVRLEEGGGGRIRGHGSRLRGASRSRTRTRTSCSSRRRCSASASASRSPRSATSSSRPSTHTRPEPPAA